MTGPVGSIVRPPWPCPRCGMTNVWTTAKCQNRRYDEASPRYQAVPPVPPQYDLYNLGEYLEKLGLKNTSAPGVVWRCSYTRPCDLCPKPGHPHSDGQTRCDDHSLQEANRG